MYVELSNEAPKNAFIVGISARRDCGADIGGGSCPASQTPYRWRHSGDAITADYPEYGKSACKYIPRLQLLSGLRFCQDVGDAGKLLVLWLSIGVGKVESIPERRTLRRSCLTLPLPVVLTPHPHTESSTSRVGHWTRAPCERNSRTLLPMRTVTSIQTNQSPTHPTPFSACRWNHLSYTTMRAFPTAVHDAAPRYC